MAGAYDKRRRSVGTSFTIIKAGLQASPVAAPSATTGHLTVAVSALTALLTLYV
jgi:hypothetical protein